MRRNYNCNHHRTIIFVLLITTLFIAESSNTRADESKLTRDIKEKGKHNVAKDNNHNKVNNINQQQDTKDRPNFVILLLDDHGYGDVGIYDNTTTETPHIDQLGKSGIQFMDMHSGASSCTPSRAALLSGRLGLRTGVTNNFREFSLGGLPTEELTFAEMLPSHSMARVPCYPCYNKHMIGKWHLGHHEGYHPSFRGFDTFYGLPYSGDMGCLDTTPLSCKPDADRSQGTSSCPSLCSLVDENSNKVGIPLYDTPHANCGSGNARIGKKKHAKKKCDKTIAEQPVNEFTLNNRYAQRAEDIIRQAAEDENASPFLLYIGFAHAHTPMAYDVSKFGNSSQRPGWKRHYGNTLAEVDDAVGRIVAALDDSGLIDNTLVILTSDNGPADVGNADCDFIGSPGPFVGKWQKTALGGGGTMKGTVWEGGHRVVGIASWPGTIRPGRISDDLVSTMDILPTVLKLAKAPSLPEDRVYDGMDLSPLLLQEEEENSVMSQSLLQNMKTKMELHEILENWDDVNDTTTTTTTTTTAETTTPSSLLSTRAGIIIGENNDVLAVDLGSGGESSSSDHRVQRVLFHPNTMGKKKISGELDAMRIGQFKLLFRTIGLRGCNSGNGEHGPLIFDLKDHVPPLVFDLKTDPGESKPLPESSLPPNLIATAMAAKTWKMNNIATTLSHESNMDQGTNKQQDAPCCNSNSKSCTCPWQQQDKQKGT